jgi:type IX secretion system PorP/SprF family membrane protein
MRFLLINIFLICCFSGIFAQQLPQFRFQPFNRTVLNPAVTGDYNSPDIILNHRSQWVGFDGAPTISTIAGKYPFRPDMAAGLFISNDVTGVTSRLYFNASYAYLLKTDYFNISFGLAWTFTQYRIKGDEITLFQPNDAALIYGLTDAAWKPDANIGVFLFADEFYFGMSAQQLFQSSFRFYQDDANGATVKSKRHYFITGGGIFETGFGDHTLNPYMNMYITGNTPFKFDIGFNYMYQNRIIGSLQYANADALVLQAGYRYEKFQITYAFDIIISRIRNVSSGAHEICLAVFLFQKENANENSAPSF